MGLPADRRETLPRVLGELAEAWRDPSAWTGMTRAGGTPTCASTWVAVTGTTTVAMPQLVEAGPWKRLAWHRRASRRAVAARL